MRYLLLHGYVEHYKDNSVIHNICRGEDGNQHDIVIIDFLPYFYYDESKCESSQITDIKCKFTESKIQSFEGKDLTKVTTTHSYNIESLRDIFSPHYEADIPFQLRLRYDIGIKNYFECDPNNHHYRNLRPIEEEINIKPKAFCVDIEVMDDTWSDADVADNAIVSITLKNELTGKYAVFINTNRPIDKSKIEQIFDEYFGDTIHYSVYTYESERDMLVSFSKMLLETKPDILYGWNFIDYDATYIETRCKKLNVTIDFRQFQVFDDMTGYKKLSENDLPSVALNEIARTELKQQKIPRTFIYEMIQNDVERLIAYNIGDVYLTSKIDAKRNILNFHLMLARVSGTELNATPHNSFIADSFFLHLANGKMILPSCNTRTVPSIDKGALVQDPSSGIIEWVASFDLSKAYPTAMIQNNLSPDTLLDGPSDTIPYRQMPSGRCYRTDKDGIVKMAAQALINEREKHQKLENKYLEENNIEMFNIHKEIEIAIKKVTNSLYGSIGQVGKKRKTNNNTFRLAHGDVASDVTRAIREVITYIEARLGDLKSLLKYAQTEEEKELFSKLIPYQNVFKKVYGDTDAQDFKVPFAELLQETNDREQSINVLKNLEELLTRSTKDYSLQSSGNDGIYGIEFEKLYKTFFQAGVKKRYVGVYEWRKGVWMEDKPIQERIEVRGYEVRRSDWSPMCKDFMNKLLEMLFIDKADEKEVGRMIRQWKRMFYDGEYNVSMKWPKRATAWVFPGDVDKNGRQKSATPQQKAIVISNTHLGRNYHKGDKPWMCYVKRINNGASVDIIALDIDDDVTEYAEIDYDTMWEKQAKNPLSRIIEGLGWNYEEMESGVYSKNTEDYF